MAVLAAALSAKMTRLWGLLGIGVPICSMGKCTVRTVCREKGWWLCAKSRESTQYSSAVEGSYVGMAVRPAFYRTENMRRPSEITGQTGLKDSGSDSQKAMRAELEAQPGFSLYRLFWKWAQRSRGFEGVSVVSALL